MAQRFLIALALVHRPSLLLADEPTSALDTVTHSEILALFRRLNQEMGIGILYISHDLASVAALCHRVAILHAGEIWSSARRPRRFSARRAIPTRGSSSQPSCALPFAERRRQGTSYCSWASRLEPAAHPGRD